MAIINCFISLKGTSSVMYVAEHWNQKMNKKIMECNKDSKDWMWPELSYSATYGKESRNLSLSRHWPVMIYRIKYSYYYMDKI